MRARRLSHTLRPTLCLGKPTITSKNPFRVNHLGRRRVRWGAIDLGQETVNNPASALAQTLQYEVKRDKFSTMTPDLWQLACDRLAEQLPEHQFNTLIRPLPPSGGNGIGFVFG